MSGGSSGAVGLIKPASALTPLSALSGSGKSVLQNRVTTKPSVGSSRTGTASAAEEKKESAPAATARSSGGAGTGSALLCAPVLSFANQFLQDSGCTTLATQLAASYDTAAAGNSSAKPVPVLVALTELDLRRCGIGAAGAKSLATRVLLSPHCTLTTRRVQQSRFGSWN